MYPLLQLGWEVDEVEVVPVHHVLEQDVDEAKWRNDGTGDAVGHDDSEDTQHPCIHGSKLVLEGLVLLDIPAVGSRLGHDHAEGVEDEAWQPQQLHAIADEGRGDDVVHKEGALVRQEDTPGETGAQVCELRATLGGRGGAPRLGRSRKPLGGLYSLPFIQHIFGEHICVPSTFPDIENRTKPLPRLS